MLRLLIKYKAKEGKAREFISYVKNSGILDSIKKDEGYISQCCLLKGIAC